MKKWYQTIDWQKFADPLFRWGAIAIVAIMAPSATSLVLGSDSLPSSTSITHNTPSSTVVVNTDSLSACLAELKLQVNSISVRLREKDIIDSLYRENQKEQATYLRQNLEEIRRFLMSRNFASR
jgi:long-subunit acyl-CoA synthetase (AMP-forming)